MAAPSPRRKCKACGSHDVRFSYPRVFDYILACFRHFEAFRCRACQRRFRVYVEVA